jgi:hypothetical protein
METNELVNARVKKRDNTSHSQKYFIHDAKKKSEQLTCKFCLYAIVIGEQGKEARFWLQPTINTIGGRQIMFVDPEEIYRLTKFRGVDK